MKIFIMSFLLVTPLFAQLSPVQFQAASSRDISSPEQFQNFYYFISLHNSQSVRTKEIISELSDKNGNLPQRNYKKNSFLGINVTETKTDEVPALALAIENHNSAPLASYNLTKNISLSAKTIFHPIRNYYCWSPNETITFKSQAGASYTTNFLSYLNILRFTQEAIYPFSSEKQRKELSTKYCPKNKELFIFTNDYSKKSFYTICEDPHLVTAVLLSSSQTMQYDSFENNPGCAPKLDNSARGRFGPVYYGGPKKIKNNNDSAPK